MTCHTESVYPATRYAGAFRLSAPPFELARELRPRMPGVFLRRCASVAVEQADTRDETRDETGDDTKADILAAPAQKGPHGPALPEGLGQREWVQGQFGLVPPWVKSASDARLRSPKLTIARVETLATSKPFSHAWLNGQRCIVPVMAFYEDDWRSGKPVPTRIARVDGEPMGLAGVWERWEKDGESIVSYALLTINADSHALMRRYPPPGADKRMPVVLNEGSYAAWLEASTAKAAAFWRAYPAQHLLANPVESKASRPRGL